MLSDYTEAKEARLTLFPITVLGPAKAGKTALVSSFVQNYFPVVYTPTQEEQVYYKTIDLVDVRCPLGLAKNQVHKLREERAERNTRCMKCQEVIDDGHAARIGDRVECRNRGQTRWSRGKVTAVKMGGFLTVLLDDDKVPRDFGEWQHVEDDENHRSRRQVVWRCVPSEKASQGEFSCGVLCRECWLQEREEQVFPAFVEIVDLPAWDSDRLKLKTHYLKFCKDPGTTEGSIVKPSSRFQGILQNEKSQQDKQSVWPFNSGAKEKEGELFLAGFDPPNDHRCNDALKEGDVVKARNQKDPTWQFGEVRSVKPLKVAIEEETKEFDEAQLLSDTPLATGRLGYFIVFDCHDKKQFHKAKEIHETIQKQREKDEIEPVVFLVATQLDKDVHSLEAESTRNEARKYVDDILGKGRGSTKDLVKPRLVYEELSAPEHRKVKRVFRRMLSMMREIEDDHSASVRPATQDDGLAQHFTRGLGLIKGNGQTDVCGTSPRNPANPAQQDCSCQ